MDGGTLDIEWRESDNHVYMTGPAEFVFEGETLPPPSGLTPDPSPVGEGNFREGAITLVFRHQSKQSNEHQ